MFSLLKVTESGERRSIWAGLKLSGQAVSNKRLARVILAYLVIVAGIELSTTLIAPHAGLLLYSVVQVQYILLLFLLCLHAAARWGQAESRLLLSLTLLPLIRIIGLSLPLAGLPLIYWILIISAPLFAAVYLIMRLLNFSWRDAGLNSRYWPWQIGVALTGMGLGYIEYQILRPAPLLDSFSWGQIWLLALILLISSGLLEELIFRRILQRAAIERLGNWPGLLCVALFFAILHIGYRSPADFLFVLVVGLFFGWVVLRTDSIVGVTLAHGLTNIVLFLVMPFWSADPAVLTFPPGVVQFLRVNGLWFLLVLAGFVTMGFMLINPVSPRLVAEDQDRMASLSLENKKAAPD